jgi:hypothetical protein
VYESAYVTDESSLLALVDVMTVAAADTSSTPASRGPQPAPSSAPTTTTRALRHLDPSKVMFAF